MAERRLFSWRQFWHSFAAVVLGNAVYFEFDRFLPVAGRHVPFKIDWGLAIDFWCCVVVYFLLAPIKWFKR
ncbi:MAG TPA: hypothetical protein VMI94_14900 [Bryobacteraceae bacterium]|nr:hypothetical protein [Bryobacteraceae bacterium]